MSANLAPNQQPIAIVGVSALFPGSTDAAGFWRDILEGRDLITDVPASHWLIDDYYDADPSAPDKTYARRGGFLDPVGFDALGFGVPPSTLPATDTAQLLALILAQTVLQDAAREQFESMDRSRISVILGVTSAQELLFSMVSRLQRPVWVKALREAGLPEDEVQAACERIAAHYVPWQESSFPGLLGNVVAGRIANRLNLGGTNCVTDAACASALSAMAMAISELQLGTSDLVISGGVDTLNDIFMYMCFSKTPALSPTGDCRPFSDQADGTMLGEGLGMVALKRLADAERDGDRIYAVIRGIGTSSDGRSKSVYAPVPEGQARALRRAYDIAGYGPETVELMEAHGTGTKAGDAAEFEGLRQVFGAADGERKQWCALGSVKSQIGHTKAAAGAAGLFKAVMALHHKVLPPSIKIDAANPKLDIDNSPFYLNTRSRPWIRGSAHPRRASVSAFGFGGSNFHATLEEYQGSAPSAERLPAHRHELVVLTAADATDLVRQARELAVGKESLARVARDSQRQFTSGSALRLAVVAADRTQLQSRLLAAAQRIEKAPDADFTLPDGTAYGVGAASGALALLFPGQGSQFPHMGADLAMHFPKARAVWDRAADLALDPERALHDVVFPQPGFGPEAAQAETARLTQTQWAQPALGATSLSMLAVLDDCGLRADLVGGHSFGELVALHVAGVLDESSLLQVARRRGELMAAAAATPGAMTALSLPIDRVRALIAAAPAPASAVVVANHNAPQQVVVSGETSAIAAFEANLSEQGIEFRRLPVASGFHSRVVAGCCQPFADFLSGIEFAPPTLPVYGNARAAVHPADPQALRAALAAQIAEPVRFVEMIEAMYAAGARTFLEVGPGAVLTGLATAILGERPHQVIALDRKHKDGVESLLLALARLVAAGVALRLDTLFATEREPALASTHNRPLTAINGSNVGKPYPPPGGSDALPKPNPPRPALATLPVETPVTQNSAFVPSPLPAPLALVAAAPAAPAVSEAWLQAYQHSQDQLAEAHLAFQRAMFESHAQYLQLSESALSGLAAIAGGPATSMTSQAPRAVAPPAPLPAMAMPAMTLATEAMPMPMPAVSPVVPTAPVAATGSSLDWIRTTPAPSLPPIPALPALATTSAVPAAPVAAAIDLTALMLQIVAEKTGYPVDMLELGMDLEGDLGIDSIKRVEILAAVDERAPGLSKLDRSRMAALHTLAEIVDYLQGQQAMVISPGSAPLVVALPTAPVAVAIDLTALMLQIVAEKTGYPVDMLELGMDLEGDLGIDSIKRVEILAAVDERAPGLSKLDRSRMAALHTLAEIVDYLQGQQTAVAPVAVTPVAASAATPAAVAAPAASAVDLTALMLQIVAEKTGYPVDMLELGMDLEGDLGIDSIKRVEILAAVDERAPGLSKLDRSRMASLHTLAEIVDYLQGQQAPVVIEAVAAAPTPTVATPAPALGRFRLELIAAPAAGMAQPGLRAGTEVCITGDAEVGECLATELRNRKVHARVVDRLPDGATACIYLGGLRAVADDGEASAINHEAFAHARRLAAQLESGRGLFVTVQDTGGAFGLVAGADSRRAWLAGLPALVKTAALEWPQAALKAIDIERGARTPQALAMALADELFDGGGELEVALPASGGRYTLHSVAEAVTPGAPAISAGEVVVVSGGARGVTASCLIEWAGQCRARFVLLGRTALTEEPAVCAGIADDAGLKRVMFEQARARGETPTPAELVGRVREVQGNREIRRTLAAIAEAGAQARYEAVDVTDAAALAALLTRVRSDWGPVAGVVHAAGVLADKRIGEKTDAQFQQVFATKVDGLRALLAATANDPLKLLCVFSSVSARCGNTGQADYAMANEVLAKVTLAQAQCRPGLVAKSLGWGPWEAGMVTPALRERFAALGVPMIPLREGAHMFAAEMSGGQRDQVELVLGGEPKPEALLFDGASERVQELDISVARSSHAYLEGHAINGQPVLPLVLAAEWLTRAARSFRPGLPQTALHDVKVLKGIRLGGFENGGDHFTIQATPLHAAQGAQLQMTIRDAQGNTNYSARVELLPDLGQGAEAPAELTLEPWRGEPLYQDLLFHRGEFELIQRLDGISDHGITATLRGVSHAGWNGETWQLDVAALDAGLQLAVLFGTRMLGGPNLPTGIDQIRSFGPAPSAGLLNATAYRRTLGPSSMTTDIVFTDDRGTRVAELLGVHNHALARA